MLTQGEMVPHQILEWFLAGKRMVPAPKWRPAPAGFPNVLLGGDPAANWMMNYILKYDLEQ